MDNSQVAFPRYLEQKFIMFLPERYFKSSFLKNIYKKLRKNLENLGITLFCIDDFINFYTNKKSYLLFDDKSIPTTHQLYIHMFKNLYYSDSIYNKKQMEKEREHLFLLAGKLGVNEIKYEIEISETSVVQTSASTTVSKLSNTVLYSKNIEKKQGVSGYELYENRGASVYVNSNTKDEVDANIKESMDLKDSQVFSYDFYKQSPKLESFVYKRFAFKMSEVEYIIESEDIFDLSLAVKAYFIEYGLSISFNKNILYNEKIKYKLKFFTDDVLSEECAKRNYEYERGKSDPFYSIRKCYDSWNNENDKKSIIYEIYDYVYKICKQTYGKIYDDENNKKINYFSLEDIIRFILKTQPEIKYEWDEFTHTAEIKDWIEEFIYEKLYANIDQYNPESNEPEDKIISELKSQYPNIDIKKINSKISWFNINWEESEENIKSTIKNELNNDCEEIKISPCNTEFTVLFGDNTMHKNKKVDNTYIKAKRSFNPVSRVVRSHSEQAEQYRSNEVESQQNYIETKRIFNPVSRVSNEPLSPGSRVSRGQSEHMDQYRINELESQKNCIEENSRKNYTNNLLHRREREAEAREAEIGFLRQEIVSLEDRRLVDKCENKKLEEIIKKSELECKSEFGYLAQQIRESELELVTEKEKNEGLAEQIKKSELELVTEKEKNEGLAEQIKKSELELVNEKGKNEALVEQIKKSELELVNEKGKNEALVEQIKKSELELTTEKEKNEEIELEYKKQVVSYNKKNKKNKTQNDF